MDFTGVNSVEKDVSPSRMCHGLLFCDIAAIIVVIEAPPALFGISVCCIVATADLFAFMNDDSVKVIVAKFHLQPVGFPYLRLYLFALSCKLFDANY